MRRLSGICGLLLFLAPVGLRLATASAESAAMRCAIACGHAMGTMKGAACCPMSDAPDPGPVFKACSHGTDAAVAPLAPASALVAVGECLRAPRGSRPFVSTPKVPARSAFLRAPDKVPLLAG